MEPLVAFTDVDSRTPARVTDQLVPTGSPLSEKVTGTVAFFELHPIEIGAGDAPETVTSPVVGLAVQPGTGSTTYLYVPFGTEKSRSPVVVPTVPMPERLTDHARPDGS